MFFYLLCAIAGAIIPWYYNLQHLLHSDIPFTPVTLLEAGMHSAMSSSLTTDFLIGASAVSAWMVAEARRLQMRGLIWYILATFLVAFAFACPLFLLFRERKLQKLN